MTDHNEIILEALDDYRRWFTDDPSNEDKEKIRQINAAIVYIKNSKPGILDDEFFEITAVSRSDIKEEMNLTDEQVEKIDDEMMRRIARKLAEDYCEQLFWGSLRIIVNHVTSQSNINFENENNGVSQNRADNKDTHP